MSLKARLSVATIAAGMLLAVGLVLLQSHASARAGLNYKHLTAIQKRIVSETLASALGPRQGLRPPGSGHLRRRLPYRPAHRHGRRPHAANRTATQDHLA